MRKKTLLVAVLATCVLLFAGKNICQAEKLFVGYAGMSVDLSHLWIAKEAGLFEKYGVDVMPIYFSGGRPLMQALIAGDIQLAATGGITSIRSNIAGADLIIIAGYINKIASTFFTAKQITKPEQLKGKAVAISGFGTSSHALTVLALKKLGLVPIKDVAIIQIGDQTARFAALLANTIQGCIIAPPLTLLARNSGFYPMLDLPRAGIPWLQEVIIANNSMLRRRQDVVKNFMKGFIEGLSLWHTDKDKTTELLARFMRIDIVKNREVLNEAYEFMKDATEKNPYPTFDGIRFQLDMIAETDAKAKGVRPEQVVDLKLLQEIDNSGFIDALYK
jgi:NitT/TauT family transport system substrate-binding protein